MRIAPLVLRPFAIGARLWLHNLEFFIKTRFVDFLFFELILQRSNITKGSESPALNILKASLFQIEITLLPELLLLLTLVELVAGLFQIGEENATFVNEGGNDLFELFRIFVIELLQ